MKKQIVALRFALFFYFSFGKMKWDVKQSLLCELEKNNIFMACGCVIREKAGIKQESRPWKKKKRNVLRFATKISFCNSHRKQKNVGQALLSFFLSRCNFTLVCTKNSYSQFFFPDTWKCNSFFFSFLCPVSKLFHVRSAFVRPFFPFLGNRGQSRKLEWDREEEENIS